MRASQEIEQPDLLSDTHACWVIKDEIVDVEFAAADGDLESAVGTNRYIAGDALLVGSTGDRWCVSRARFDTKYLPVAPTQSGKPGRYRNLPIKVRAKVMSVDFSVARSAGGDLLRGDAGDWLLQYAPGDYGVVAQSRFARVYRSI
jgi:hypothetical protein